MLKSHRCCDEIAKVVLVLSNSYCIVGAVGAWLPLHRLQGLPGQHEEPGGVLPGDAGHGDEERGLLRCQRAQLHVGQLHPRQSCVALLTARAGPCSMKRFLSSEYEGWLASQESQE